MNCSVHQTQLFLFLNFAKKLVFYPKICQEYGISNISGGKLLRDLFLPLYVIYFVISMVLYVYTETIITIIYGSYLYNSFTPLKILAFAPFFTLMNAPFFILLMYNQKYSEVFKLNLSIAVFSIVLNYCLISQFKLIGLCWGIVIFDFATLVVYYIYYKILIKWKDWI